MAEPLARLGQPETDAPDLLQRALTPARVYHAPIVAFRLWCEDPTVRVLAFVAAVLVLSGCSRGDDGAARSGPPELASGRLIPERCVPRTPQATATIAFVANGAAWALAPRGERLTCLFTVRRPGPFAWGPRGDRALLARLEVKSFGDAPHRPPTRARPSATSWGRPIGKSIVFVGSGGRALLKTHPAGGGFSDVTPVQGVHYERVVYHPSGLAFAFVLRRTGREEVWISSNVGREPRRLVHGRFHTGFDALAFTQDGRTLYFAAQHGDTHVDLHTVPVGGATEAPVAWRGGPHERVTAIHPGLGSEVAVTVGRSCETQRAVVVTLTHAKGKEALPDADRSRALGWIDDAHVLVASGGCGAPLDLYSVAVRNLEARLLAKGVTAAAVRKAEPLPPPPLPAAGAGSGFA